MPIPQSTHTHIANAITLVLRAHVFVVLSGSLCSATAATTAPSTVRGCVSVFCIQIRCCVHIESNIRSNTRLFHSIWNVATSVICAKFMCDWEPAIERSTRHALRIFFRIWADYVVAVVIVVDVQKQERHSTYVNGFEGTKLYKKFISVWKEMKTHFCVQMSWSVSILELCVCTYISSSKI